MLHLVRVSDRTSVLHLYTGAAGRSAYYVYGSRSKGRSALFSPLTLLSIDAVHREGRDIQQLRDCSAAYVAVNTPFDIRRRTVALFITEVLYRTLTLPEPDAVLFSFLSETVKMLDTRPDPENAPLEFLLDYISFLGFAPDWNDPSNSDFAVLKDIDSLSWRTLSLPRTERQRLINGLMNYYLFHISDFRIPKSLDILTQIFD